MSSLYRRERNSHGSGSWKISRKPDVTHFAVYLGNFGPEISETLLAKHFDGPKMFVAAAKKNPDNGGLMDGRGDAYCGMLNASYNLKTPQCKGLHS